MVTNKGGTIKLLDFGLAKQRVPELGPDDETRAAPKGLTKDQGIVGTLQYMSPEQLQGNEADPRSDVFAFGCVLYEMLSGKKAFSGSTTASVIAAIIERDPEPLQTTPPLGRVIRTCIEKGSRQTFPERAGSEEGSSLGDGRRDRRSFTVVVRLGWLGRRSVVCPDRRCSCLHSLPPETAGCPSGAIDHTAAGKERFRRGILRAVTRRSPPGVYRAIGGDRAKAALDSVVGRGYAPADRRYRGAIDPFWSPDGRSIGFMAQRKLKTLDLSGGAPAVLANAENPRGGNWSSTGVILFAPEFSGPFQRVPIAGGPATTATAIDPKRKETSHKWPWFLPDGHHFLYASTVSGTDNATIYAGSLDSPETRFVARTNSNAVYASGYLLFLRDGTLMAQPFDARGLTTTGEAVPIAVHVDHDPVRARGFFAVSDGGGLVFQSMVLGGESTRLARPRLARSNSQRSESRGNSAQTLSLRTGDARSLPCTTTRPGTITFGSTTFRETCAPG